MILILSGCANTDYYRAVADCRALNPEEGACAVEWAAYEKAEDRKARKEAKRLAMQCPKGMGRLKGGHDDNGSCVHNSTLRKVLRDYGY